MRQMKNRLDGKGQVIIDLADLFLVESAGQSQQTTPEAEHLLQKVHQGGKIDEDLDVVYWNSADDLVASMVSDLVSVLPQEEADPPIYKLWRNEIIQNSPERLQVLTPHRGELHGVEALNIELQSVLTNDLIDRRSEEHTSELQSLIRISYA